MALRTAALLRSLTDGESLRTRETTDFETPATAATSRIVGFGLRRRLVGDIEHSLVDEAARFPWHAEYREVTQLGTLPVCLPDSRGTSALSLRRFHGGKRRGRAKEATSGGWVSGALTLAIARPILAPWERSHMSRRAKEVNA
jgi:hypothetical protein